MYAPVFRKRLLGALAVLTLAASALVASQTIGAKSAFAVAAQPALVTPDMLQELRDTGSVSLSVTLSSDTSLDSARGDSGLVTSEGSEVVSLVASANAAEIVITTEEALTRLAADQRVTSIVRPPHEGELMSQGVNTAIPLGAQQLRTMREAAQMHTDGFRGEGVTVATVDSGIDNSHPDLVSSLTYEYCVHEFAALQNSFCPNGAVTQSGSDAAIDRTGHGTRQAGIIAGDGTIAPIGMAPAASLEVIRITGSSRVDIRDSLLALDHILAERHDVDVVLLGFGSARSFTDVCDRDVWPAYFDTVQALRDKGVLLVAPSGNSGSNAMIFPACLDQVVSVTGLQTSTPVLASFASATVHTDVAAPATAVVSTNPNASQLSIDGTSFSVAFAAGCAALFKQSGTTEWSELRARLSSPNVTATRGSLGFSVPLLQCAPLCAGSKATVNVALGEVPTSVADVVLGSDGDDQIDAGEGDDLVCARGGNDRIAGGPGADVVYGEAGNDVLRGQAGSDTLFGGSGNDVIYGDRGSDQIQGGDGNDRLFGGADNDVMAGGNGNDTMHGDRGDDELSGQLGDDRLFGYADNDRLNGGQGNDRLHGNNGNDEILGNSGDDTLYGYNGDDTLGGGAGLDTCRGNHGQDAILQCEAPPSGG